MTESKKNLCFIVETVETSLKTGFQQLADQQTTAESARAHRESDFM